MFIVCMSAGRTYPAAANLSLELRNANLQDAIRLIAGFLDMNIIISPAVRGAVTLRLHDVVPDDALNLLLTSYGLEKWKSGNVVLIAPQDELIKRKQDELKWQELREATAPVQIRVWQIRYARAEEIARLLQDEHASLISRRGRVRVDVRTNRICIQDISSRVEEVRRLIDRLDLPVQQISIEARLASVDNDFEHELGIQFSVNPEVEDRNAAQSLLREKNRYSLAIAKLADGSLLDVKLNALEKAGHARLISSPSLFTANQQPASIEAGEEVPYQEVSESGGTAVTFKKAVLGLKVTPQILPGNKVLLQLQVNQDRPINKVILGMPAISTRQILTSIIASNGQTIVLGGIYETNRESGYQGLPLISRVPLLGVLFRQQNTLENKRQLLIFVTPKIIS
jgi:type IV pilus assembly protein PilQ